MDGKEGGGMETKEVNPEKIRLLIREGNIATPTSGLCPGYAQANLVVLPRTYAYDFLLFAQRNPKSCPLLEVSDVGSRKLAKIAQGVDIATDLPKYRIYERGKLIRECIQVSQYWREDLVSFLIGCSFSFESELIEAGIEMRHNTEHCNVPMYVTNLPCAPAGIFHGNMVVSMRPIPYKQVVASVTMTARIPKVHGAPVHIGNPREIGIHDLGKPDFGDAVSIKEGEVPVFWACGVTPQAVIMASKPEFCITHAPGHMLITDVKNVELME